MREPQPEPQTESLEITEVQSDLVSLVHDVAQKQSRVLVEEEGAPVAAIVSLEDYRQLTRLDARRRVVEAIREAFHDVPDDELERETAKALEEVRAEMRAEREVAARS
jgi:prevent-host-death family protein